MIVETLIARGKSEYLVITNWQEHILDHQMLTIGWQNAKNQAQKGGENEANQGVSIQLVQHWIFQYTDGIVEREGGHEKHRQQASKCNGG